MTSVFTISYGEVKEITLGMAPHIVYRTIGGMLDIFFFPGPTPDDVIRQFTALVGKPAVPPYWSLGFQVIINSALTFNNFYQHLSA
uniref:Alpha-glucosidase n=1 Tax=Ascaris lumbricoides TaxID=6252 RepID=A0A0M3HMD3_ASCLU